MGPLGASVRALRPRCGLPDATIAPLAQRVSRFSAISKALSLTGVDKQQCTTENLSALVLNLRAFLDKNFGRNAPPDTRTKLTIFPASIFTDLSEFGPLAALLQVCFRYAQEHGLLPLDFDDEERKDDFVQLILNAEKVLKKDHYFRVIKVFISPLLDQEEAKELRDIVQRHGAAIVSNSYVATHLVYPDPDNTREHHTDGQVLVRVLERAKFDEETYCYLHWFHHPDSYNDWVPDSEVLGHVYVPRQRKKREQWHVQARWVRDLDVYNEWMNELDYEMPANFADLVGRSPRPASLDANGKQPSALVRIRLRMPKKEEAVRRASQFEPSKRVGLPSISSGFAEKMNGDIQSSSENQTMMDIGDLSAVKVVNGGLADDLMHQPDTSNGSSDEQDSDGRAEQTTKIPVGNGVFIPFFSKWFSMQSVHEIERKALPEFFEGRYASKNEGTYREIRNFIVQTWRESHKEYLSGTAARRHLAGDACCILRVHSFLEHWGFINYDCSAQGAAPHSFIPPPRPLPLRAGCEKDGSQSPPQLILDDGSKAQIKNGKIVKFGRQDEVLGNGRTEAILIRDTDRTGQTSSIAEPPAREPIEYHCDSCGADCSVVRFHCATKADVDLCAPCYQNAKYSSSMKPRDFIQMNSAGVHSGTDDTDGEVWTESETLLLLEALEMYGDNWTLVSEHVGSKGKSQCVVQFLRLPIEDAFLDNTTKCWWGVTPPGDADERSPAEMLRGAGARESALAGINTKGSVAKPFAGQPLVFGDQISTIVPFAGMLSSLSPPEILKELTSVVGVASTRKRKRCFLDVALLESYEDEKRDREKTEQRQEEPTEETVNTFMTGRLYKKLRKMIPSPAKFLRMEHGEKLGCAAFSLVKHGAMRDTEVMELRLDTSPGALFISDSSNRTGFGEGMNGNSPATAMGKSAEAMLNGHANATRGNIKLGHDVDVESSTAVAIASLAAASASASYRQQVEQMEIDRLYSLLAEIRVQIIQRRLAHLSSIAKYEQFAREYRERKLSEEMAIRLFRQTSLIRTRAVEKAALAQGGPNSTWSGEASTQPLKTGQHSDPSARDAAVRTWTEQDGHAAEVGRDFVPDFSEDVELHRIRGATPDGRIVSEEADEITPAPATSGVQGRMEGSGQASFSS